MKMQDIYNVPIIHSDLPVETTILQIANSLEYLTNTVNDVFNKIDARIDENCQRTAALKERIDKANEKINKLVGSKKATIVYSSAKYPASHVHKYPKATFKRDESLRFKHDATIISKPLEYDEKLLNERLHFFHVKSNEKKKTDAKKIPEEGLGFIPPNINSVTSMLLYNTKENPYDRYVSLDPLNSSSNSKAYGLDKNSTNNMDMEEAPISISNRFNTIKNYADAYFYSPNFGEVPQLDVPIDLPDLPGIADDISYDFIESGPAIAPSLLNSPSNTILDLPDLSEIKSSSSVDDNRSIQSISESPDIKLPDVSAEKAKKIDETDKNTLKNTSNVSEQPELKQNTQNVSIPAVPSVPPPPPPMLAPPPLPPTLPEPVSTSQTKASSGPDGRANLMAAIRQAGGVGKAKLRAAKPLQDEFVEKKPSTSGPGNLMADLHAKLSMRRKGISGSKSDSSPNVMNKDRGDGSVMDKISAMIPPPPKLERNTESETDTDWE